MTDNRPHPVAIDDYSFHGPRPYVGELAPDVGEHQDQAPAGVALPVGFAAAIAERTAQLLQAGAFQIPADVADELTRQRLGGWMNQWPIGPPPCPLWLRATIRVPGTIELELRDDDGRHIWRGTLAPPRRPGADHSRVNENSRISHQQLGNQSSDYAHPR